MADPYGYDRPTDVALTDSINTFRRKVNQIGNDIGNKLRLDSGSDPLWGYVPSFHSDSDLVGALLELDYRIREQDSDLYLRTDGGDLFIVNGKKGNAIHMQLTWDSAANTVELDFPRHTVTVDAAGDIILDADNGNIIFKDGGTEDYKFATDGTISRTGDLTVDVTGNIVLDADGANIDFKDGGVARIEYGLGTTNTIATTGNLAETVSGNQTTDVVGSIKDSAGTTHTIVAKTAIAQTSGTTFTQTSGGNFTTNVTGNVLIDASGDIVLDADGADIDFKDGGTTRFAYGMGATNTLDVTGNLSETVSGNQTTDVTGSIKDSAGTTHTIVAGTAIAQTSGTTTTLTVGSNHTVSVGGNSISTVTGNYTNDVTGSIKDSAGTTHTIVAKTAIAQTSGTTFAQTSGGTFTQTSGGNFTTNVTGAYTVDASTNITLDADGGNIYLKDNGTQFGSLTNTSGNIIIKSGTSTVMTGSGENATFNNNVDIDNDLTVDRDAQVTRNLNVDGITTLDSTTIDGSLTVNDSAYITGNLDVGGNVTVTGNTVLNGHVDLGDGTGDNISIIGRVDTSVIPDADGTYDLGSSSLEWRNLYIDGTANIDSLIADTADINGGTIDGTSIGSSSRSTGYFTNVDANGITTLDSTTIDGSLTVNDSAYITGNLNVGGNVDIAGTLTVDGVVNFKAGTNGSVTLGDANTDNVVFNADVNSHIIPNTDNAYDLGSSGQEWRNLYIDGIANIDSLVADTADINAGTIDNTVIGGTTKAAGSFTDLVADSADINAGTIDGTSIGASSASTGNFTTLNASGITTLDSTTIDGSLTVNDSAYVTGNLNIGGNVDIAGTLTVDGVVNFKAGTNGSVTLGDGNTDNVVFNADVNSHIIPNTDDAYDLGSSDQEWRNLYVDGTAYIDALVADTADINGGSVDGATIGASSASTGAFTTVTTTGSLTVNDSAYVTGNFDVGGDVVIGGTLVTGTSLTTTATDHAAAINELDSDIGIIANMTTTTKLSVIAAINELNSRIIDVYDSAGTLLNPA